MIDWITVFDSFPVPDQYAAAVFLRSSNVSSGSGSIPSAGSNTVVIVGRHQHPHTLIEVLFLTLLTFHRLLFRFVFSFSLH